MDAHLDTSNHMNDNYSKIYSKMYLKNLVKSVGNFLIQPQYWQQQIAQVKLNLKLLNVARTERYQHRFIKLFERDFELVDSISFLWTYEDIFAQEIYRFKTQASQPRIIDCGANIGLSVLYFKQLYPQSQVIAFEPDRNIFNVLKNNVQNYGLSQIELVNKAVWNCESVLEFISEGTDAGRLSNDNEVESKCEKYQVDTVRLRDYLEQPVDLLKIDIEGAETEVVKDCSDLLGNVKNFFIEYHSFANKAQSLNILINLLSKAGFRLHVHANYKSPQPFYKCENNNGMDMLLNIFAFR